MSLKGAPELGGVKWRALTWATGATRPTHPARPLAQAMSQGGMGEKISGCGVKTFILSSWRQE